MLISSPPPEKTPYPLDNFESRHHPIEYRYSRAEVIHQGMRASGSFGWMEQFTGLVGYPLFGGTDFRQFLRFLLADHFQRNHGWGGILRRIHAHWSLRSKLARNRVRGWMMSRRRNP